MGEMSILSSNGDDKIEWDANNEHEIEIARKKFSELKEEGYTFYELKTDGSQGKKVIEFDPKIESIIGIPTMIKG